MISFSSRPELPVPESVDESGDNETLMAAYAEVSAAAKEEVQVRSLLFV